MVRDWIKPSDLTKKKSPLLHKHPNYQTMIGDGTWEMFQKTREQQLQQNSKDHNQFSSKYELRVPKKKKHLKKSTILTKPTMVSLPPEKLSKPLKDVRHHACKMNDKSKLSYMNPKKKSTIETLYKNYETNWKNDSDTNELNDNEFEVTADTKKFFKLIRNAVETGVKSSMELIITSEFQNLNSQIEKLNHSLKKLGGISDLFNELNNKITNYGEDHSRRLSQIGLKLEYDRLFYQNLFSNVNSILQQQHQQQQKQQPSSIRKEQQHYPLSARDSTKLSSQRTTTSNQRRRNCDKKLSKKNNSYPTRYCDSQLIEKNFNINTNNNNNNPDYEIYNSSPKMMLQSSIDRKKQKHVSDSVTLEQILHAVGNYQETVASSSDPPTMKSSKDRKSKQNQNHDYYYSSPISDAESRHSSDCNSSSESRTTYIPKGTIGASATKTSLQK